MKPWKTPPPLFLLPLLLLAACGGPPPEPDLDRLYRALVDRPAEFDRDCLLGKRIVIDPGHGGDFSGAVGAGGMAEKDANLGVALYLWGLLTEAGADARLTRAADRDFAGGDTTAAALEKDLAARIAFADSLRPHLFLSIHHNAAADTNRSRNRVETYYREGDEASEDAARRIHAALARNLGIVDGEARAGNYAVLRNARWTAVLGEPSYLSHPPVEKKLALAEKQRLEAEAYFLGIVDYFRRGVPETRIDAPAGTIRLPGDFFFSGSALDETGHAGVDPSSVRVLLDGRRLETRFDPAAGSVRAALPALLAAGPHRVTLHARNREGNAAALGERVFVVDPPPARATVSGLRAPGEKTVHLLVRLEDHRGLPAAEGKRVTVEGAGPAAAGTARGGVISLAAAPDSLPAVLRVRGEEFDLRAPLEESDLESPAALLFVLGPDGEPAAGTVVWIGDSLAGTTGPDGWLGLARAPASGMGARVEGTGLPCARFAASGTAIDTLRIAGPPPPLDRLAVLIDPAGRGDDGARPSSAILLAAARDIEEILRFWGALPSLTREGALPVPEERRIPLARSRGADYWITLDTGSDYEVRHHPGSRRGEPLARSVAAEMERLLGRPVPARPAADRVLRETPCPALRILLPPPGEENPGGRALLRCVAAAIAEGIRLRLDPSPETRPTLLFPGLAGGDGIRVDDRVSFGPGRTDVLRVVLPGPGEWMLRIRRDGAWETRVVETQPGAEILVP
ncbi:MAG: N-acetylmuramoyl-L-alanine amidase [Candidatus Eisenbacteria bacterium]|nr:N-acetylmuramoyl-L-alanine amidase [Candidatus Eisenbacteria bacterium]